MYDPRKSEKSFLFISFQEIPTPINNFPKITFTAFLGEVPSSRDGNGNAKNAWCSVLETKLRARKIYSRQVDQCSNVSRIRENFSCDLVGRRSFPDSNASTRKRRVLHCLRLFEACRICARSACYARIVPNDVTLAKLVCADNRSPCTCYHRTMTFDRQRLVSRSLPT